MKKAKRSNSGGLAMSKKLHRKGKMNNLYFSIQFCLSLVICVAVFYGYIASLFTSSILLDKGVRLSTSFEKVAFFYGLLFMSYVGMTLIISPFKDARK